MSRKNRVWHYALLCKVETEFYRASNVQHLWCSTVRVTHTATLGMVGVDVCVHSGWFMSSPCLLLSIRELTCWEKFLLEASFRNRRTTECNHIFNFCKRVRKLFLDNKWIQFYMRERLVQHIGVKKKPKQTSCKLSEVVYYLWKLDMFEIC